jgi:hypothetical protein
VRQKVKDCALRARGVRRAVRRSAGRQMRKRQGETSDDSCSAGEDGLQGGEATDGNESLSEDGGLTSDDGHTSDDGN